MSGGLQPVLQAAVSNGLSLDPFSFGHDGWAASEVDVGRGEIVDALVVSAVVVVGDEGFDLGFEIAGLMAAISASETTMPLIGQCRLVGSRQPKSRTEREPTHKASGPSPAEPI